MIWERVEARITDFIMEKCEGKNAIVGLSGGLDSSVVVALAVKALGKDRVIGMMMPDMEVAGMRDVADAIDLVHQLKMKHYYMIDISKIKHPFLKFIENDRLVIGNTVARIRMTLLYAHALSKNALVIGTSDKSEILLGFFTKFGDGAADILPIADLYKTEVREFAKYLGIPARIIEKPSSPNLWPNQTAEGDLGFSYKDIDEMLQGKKEVHEDILARLKNTKHKRNPASVCYVERNENNDGL